MPMPRFKLSHAGLPLTTPTYDGSGQAVHPDITVFTKGFKGRLSQPYTHIMAMTPYPNGNEDYENPSIIVSNNPESAFVEDNIPNPIDSQPGPSKSIFGYASRILRGRSRSHHNCDTDIVYHDRKFYCYYNDSVGSRSMHRRSSQNLVNWHHEEDLLGILNHISSPAVIYDEHDGKWKMWGVQYSGFKVPYYESDNGLRWTFKGYTDIPRYIYWDGANRNCWHIDIQKTWFGKKYYALIVYDSPPRVRPCFLFFGESSDGLHWTVYDEPILAPRSGCWDENIYRSSFIIASSKIKVWYSASTMVSNVWHIGYTEATLDFVDSDDITLNVVDVRSRTPHQNEAISR